MSSGGSIRTLISPPRREPGDTHAAKHPRICCSSPPGPPPHATQAGTRTHCSASTCPTQEARAVLRHHPPRDPVRETWRGQGEKAGQRRSARTPEQGLSRAEIPDVYLFRGRHSLTDGTQTPWLQPPLGVGLIDRRLSLRGSHALGRCDPTAGGIVVVRSGSQQHFYGEAAFRTERALGWFSTPPPTGPT